jgi:hypothetical protein
VGPPSHSGNSKQSTIDSTTANSPSPAAPPPTTIHNNKGYDTKNAFHDSPTDNNKGYDTESGPDDTHIGNSKCDIESGADDDTSLNARNDKIRFSDKKRISYVSSYESTLGPETVGTTATVLSTNRIIAEDKTPDSKRCDEDDRK